MRRLTRAISTAALALILVPFAAPTAAFASVDAQKAEVERIVNELERLEQQADELSEEYNDAVQEKAGLDEDIEAAKVRIADKEGELGEMQTAISELAVRAYTGSGTDVLGPLFNDASTYTAELQGGQLRSAALDQGTVTTDDLDQLLTELNEEREQLDDKLQRQEQLIDDIDSKRTATDERASEYESKRSAAEARLGELIAAEEKRRAEAAWAKAQAELRAAQAAPSGAAAPSGGSNGGGQPAAAANGGGAAPSGGGGQSAPAAPAPAVNVAVSGQAGTAVAAAQSQLGVPYSYATSNPGVSFDCSGLTHYAWAQAGVSLPRNSRQQAGSVPNVPPGSAQPGDLIFYNNPISHVGIFVGGGQMIHAPRTGDVVKVSGVRWGSVTAVGRPG